MFQHLNHGVPEGEEEEQEQEIENLFENIMKENFPHLAKEIHTSQESTESPKQVGLKEDHPKIHHN